MAKRFLPLFAWLTLFAFPPGARACLSREEAGDLATAFQLQNGEAPLDFAQINLCDPAQPLTATLEGLSFLRNFSHLPAPASPANLNILGTDAYAFFSQRAERVSLMADGNGLCGAGAKGASGFLTFIAYAGENRQVHVCSAITKLDPLLIAETLVHESRHLDGDRYNHVTCHRGPFRGARGTCDPSYQAQGSYAVGAEYKLRLSEHEQLDPALRLSARTLGFLDLFERFDDSDNGVSPELLLLDDSGRLLGYNGEAVREILPAKPGRVLVPRLEANVLFDRASGSAETYFFGQWAPAPGKLAESFREGLLGEAQGAFIDALYTKNIVCLLFPKELRCVKQGLVPGEIFSVPIGLKPAGFFYSTSASVVKAGVAYLVSEDGSYYEIPDDADAFAAQGEAALRLAYEGFDYRKEVFVPGLGKGHFVMSRSGKVFEKFGGSPVLEQVPGLEGIKIRAIAPTLLLPKELQSL